jgi:hypothetical protein
MDGDMEKTVYPFPVVGVVVIRRGEQVCSSRTEGVAIAYRQGEADPGQQRSTTVCEQSHLRLSNEGQAGMPDRLPTDPLLSCP